MNAIVICMDTLRWDYLGCYGNEAIQTPGIDAFARHCMRFDNAHCGSFPTIPMRTDAFVGNVGWPVYGWRDLAEDETTFVECLRDAGYYTAFVHDTSNMERAGFGEVFDENVWLSPPEGWEENKDKVQFPVPQEHIRQDGIQFVRQRAQWMHFEHETDWFVAQTMLAACKWLEDNYKRDNFFLWVDTFEIHEDWYAPDYYTDYYSPDYEGPDYSFPNYGYTDIYEQEHMGRLRARYSAEVTLTDRWVGHLLRQIEYMSLLDDTMVILISDHGMYLGEHRRMVKHTVDAQDPWPIYDEVGRLPLLVYLPGSGRADTRALAQPADLMPTILDACDAEGPDTYGRSLLPVIAGERGNNHDYVFTSNYSAPGKSAPGNPSCITVTGPRWTLVTGPDTWPTTLHDRHTDPHQTNNVIEDNRRVAEEMQASLAAFMRDCGADDDYIAEYAQL